MEKNLCKNDLCCFKDHEKRERNEKCFSQSKLRKYWNSSSAFSFCSLAPLLLYSACWGGWGRLVFFLPKQEAHRKPMLDEKFAEESRISSLLVPILLLAFPGCFSWTILLPKFAHRLLNSLLCPPGLPLPNPKVTIRSGGWTLQCLTHLFLASVGKQNLLPQNVSLAWLYLRMKDSGRNFELPLTV